MPDLPPRFEESRVALQRYFSLSRGIERALLRPENGSAARLNDPQANAEALKQAGVNSHYYVSPQTAHEWQSWRWTLYQFAPLLFQD